MSQTDLCPRCGARLSVYASQAFCPQCRFPLGTQRSATAETAPAGVTPGPSKSAPSDAPTEAYVGRLESPGIALPKHVDLPEAGCQFGNYNLIRQLGTGGMGTVFEAEDLESGRRVALKLLAHSLESPEARNRFFREGRLAASINHPNSVYVYGTEVIDGTPAISMEYIAGGTLRDRVRQHGPLPVTQAVDIILQIIDGLEAAAKLGVLHRDVKPSNCFIGADGTVKVGDFGLSISTTARGDTQLTQPGSFLGTPTFSSPEQLRGDDLNVRSDIYAVGVTLYYLLTGSVPFDSDNLVKLLATVLQQPAPSPAKFRKEIPHGLARAVLRCLAKQPSDRFKNYAELRAALVPYNSTAPRPAVSALRGLAGVCDGFVCTVAAVAIQIGWIRDYLTDSDLFRSTWSTASTIVGLVLHVVYFAVPEGLWGASLGKALCGLRVVDRNRSVIGIPRAAARAAIYLVFPNLIFFAYWIIRRPGAPLDPQTWQSAGGFWAAFLSFYSSLLMLALLFSTARRRNGYAGLHDLATGSRVIRRSTYSARPALAVEDPSLPDTTEKSTIGPYHVLDSLHQTESEQFLLGYDTRLLRRVWIHKLPTSSPPVAAALRSMGRVGRLRWINGRRSADECWDAYEALTGKPLLSLLEAPQPWSIVRFWLLDLALELSAAEGDDTLPDVMAPDRVWITAEGRAKLLDFPAPGTPAKPQAAQVPSGNGSTAPAARRFLLRVAASALGGRVIASEDARTDGFATPLPVDAHALLARIPAGATLDQIADDLKQLVKRTPSVSRLRRVAMLFSLGSLPIFLMILSVLGVLMFLQTVDPDIAELQRCLERRLAGPPDDQTKSQHQMRADEMREAFEVYIAGTFRDTISDQKAWNSPGALTIPQLWRSQAERIIAERRRPSAEELQKATAVVEPVLKEYKAAIDRQLIEFQMFFTAVGWLWVVTIPGILAALALRRGMILRAFGVDCVTRTGVPASRLRMLWRTIVLTLPALLVLILALVLIRRFAPYHLAVLLLILGLLLALIVWSSLLKVRGLADRLSGTYPVPR